MVTAVTKLIQTLPMCNMRNLPLRSPGAVVLNTTETVAAHGRHRGSQVPRIPKLPPGSAQVYLDMVHLITLCCFLGAIVQVFVFVFCAVLGQCSHIYTDLCEELLLDISKFT